MNTRDQVNEAIEDFKAFRNGFEKARGWKSKHARDGGGMSSKTKRRETLTSYKVGLSDWTHPEVNHYKPGVPGGN